MYSKHTKITILGVSLAILFGIGLYFFGQGNDNANFIVSQVINQNNCFVDSRDSCKIELPDLYLIQENSIKASSPPIAVTPQILGSLGAEPKTIRKEVIEYTVEPGNSLWGIAHKFDISLDTICWANDLTKNSIIKQGQKLVILPVSGVLHFVKSGDTLSELAEKYKVKAEEIAEFNDISAQKIFIGDILIIQGGKKSSSPYIAIVPLADAYFVFPCIGKITQGLHWHNAIDVANKCGTPIYAAAGGSVQKAGYIKIGGNRVRIIHPNGVVTYYGHLSKILVSPGQNISQGQLIGYMGRTGRATGCHIHFGVTGASNPLAKYSLGSWLTWK